ncbi:myosin heavy chain kinase b [Phtheirospermum japonicum]|uniref:Myosin heavy chain kinase b n=1 Tax=Phtheirospermum japonicum TaxID=374723 RepID=A0A830C845_9LAMI|nr:myosin heavy chain kinase b [Phtheirospermum japonicum]
MSPETPWTRSPMRASPSPTLPYDCLASLHFTKGNIFSLTITKDFIFTGSSSSKIHAWKLPDCAEMGYIRAPSGEIRAMLAYDKLLFTTHGDCSVRAWEISPIQKFRLKKITTLPRRSFFSFPRKNIIKVSISCLAYNIKEKLLFTGSMNQTVSVWRISEKRCVESFIAHEGCVNAIVINEEDDGCVFTCSSDGTLKIWRRVFRESSHILITVLSFQQTPINALALSTSPSFCFLYSGSSNGTINFWEKEENSGRYNHAGFLHGHHFAVLCLVTIGDLILSGSDDATIRIWRREGDNSLHSSLAVIDGHHGPVKCLSASVMESDECVGGLLVCSASLDQTLKVWRVKVKCDRVKDNT